PTLAIAPEYFLNPVTEQQSLPLSLENLEQRALAVTVRVIASENTPSGIKVRNAASGILIGKRNATYFVITNKHVLIGDSNQVVTSDGKSHRAALVESVNFHLADVVLLSFQTNTTYPTARLGLTSDLKIGDWVFATGFPKRSQAWKFAEGQYALAAPKPIESGYAFGYSSEVESGMSGGAVMDAYGRVVAVNGVHAKPLWGKPSYLYANGEKPCETIREEMANLSWAIPMETVIQSMSDLRVASLETVQTKDNFPNPFAARHPSPEFWQWRSSLLSKCVVPISSLVNLAWTNVIFPPLTFSSRSLYSQITPKVYQEDYMSELSFRKFDQFDRRSLVNSALTFSFTVAASVMTNTPAIAQVTQPITQPATENILLTQIPQPTIRNNSEEDQRAKAQIYLSQGQTLFEQGQYDRSMSLVNQSIDLNPNNPLAWQLLGNCLKKMGRDQEALSAYDQAIRSLSVTRDPAIAPANSPQVFTQPNQANQPNNQSTNDIVQLWTERARTLDRLNRYQESVTAYDQALKLRCQEQLLRVNEPFPSICQNYLSPASSPNNFPATVPNDANRGTVVIPVSPSQPPNNPTNNPTNPSKPNRGVW
ncbi:MAG: tetratricopeptide repeat-containing serine protease family protein, partial [Pseudanabaena sp.]